MMIICTTSGCINDNEPEGPSLAVGDPLPQFSVTMNDGEVVSTNSLKGKVPVIIFFNTDCSDCQKELPVIQQLWEKYRNDSKVMVLAIAREETEEEISKYWREHDLTLPYSPQETREVYSLFAPSVIPRIYIADQDGVIKANFDDSQLPTLDTLEVAVSNASSL